MSRLLFTATAQSRAAYKGGRSRRVYNIIAFDQHAQSVVAAVLEVGASEPAVHALAADLPSIGRFVTRIAKHAGVRCCYEAGPCGFSLHRF